MWRGYASCFWWQHIPKFSQLLTYHFNGVSSKALLMITNGQGWILSLSLSRLGMTLNLASVSSCERGEPGGRPERPPNAALSTGHSGLAVRTEVPLRARGGPPATRSPAGRARSPGPARLTGARPSPCPGVCLPHSAPAHILTAHPGVSLRVRLPFGFKV